MLVTCLPVSNNNFRNLLVILVHDSYHKRVIYADIALLKMRYPWRFTDFVKPVCLPSHKYDPEDGAICAIAGWGSTDGNRQVLNQATIPKFNWKR